MYAVCSRMNPGGSFLIIDKAFIAPSTSRLGSRSRLQLLELLRYIPGGEHMLQRRTNPVGSSGFMYNGACRIRKSSRDQGAAYDVEKTARMQYVFRIYGYCCITSANDPSCGRCYDTCTIMQPSQELFISENRGELSSRFIERNTVIFC